MSSDLCIVWYPSAKTATCARDCYVKTATANDIIASPGSKLQVQPLLIEKSIGSWDNDEHQQERSREEGCGHQSCKTCGGRTS
eukprot:5553401-Amphidinium_carterae.1